MSSFASQPTAPSDARSSRLRRKQGGEAQVDQSASSGALVRAGRRPQDLVAFEVAVVALFLDSAATLGIPKSVAAIYGICFASAEPLSFTEVRERLSISAGSISQGLRVLREVGALKLVRTPLYRRELFTPDLELRKLIAHYIQERLEKQLDLGSDRLKAIGRALPNQEPAMAEVLGTRLKALQVWHGKARTILPIVKGFLKLG